MPHSNDTQPTPPPPLKRAGLGAFRLPDITVSTLVQLMVLGALVGAVAGIVRREYAERARTRAVLERLNERDSR